MRARLNILTVLCAGAAVLFVCITAVSVADGGKVSAERIFYKANDLYEAGKYDEAVEAYLKLVREGKESGNLYYNLGNSYFKTGLLGKAVLYYEKARRLMPRDGDLEANYKHALSFTEGTLRETDRVWFLRFIYNTFEQFSLNEITILLSSIFLFIFITMVIGIYSRARRPVIISALILLFLFSAAFIALCERMDLLGKEAVVMIKSTDAKFEPFNRATTHFTLYEGMKARVILRKRGWDKIQRPDGKAGWVESSVIEFI